MFLGVWKHGHVLVLELQRPPNNFINAELVEALATELEASDRDDDCRAVVLASAGKHFCAGADLSRRLRDGTAGHIYGAASRLVRTRKPIVAAIHGAAVGAGLGLAMLADFRVGCPEARLSTTLHALVDDQQLSTAEITDALAQRSASNSQARGRLLHYEMFGDLPAGRYPDVAKAMGADEEIAVDAEPHRPPRHLRVHNYGDQPAPFARLIEFVVPDREHMLLREHRARAKALREPIQPVVE